MLGKTKTLAKVLDGIESELKTIRTLFQSNGGNVHGMQLTPTTAFGLKTAGVDQFLRVISLGKDIPNGGGWLADHEHWFRMPGVDVEQLLANKPDITITLKAACPNDVLCSDVQQHVSDVANWPLQLRARGVLKPADWGMTVPQILGNVHYYEGASPESVRLALVTAGADLKQTIWLATSDQLDCYFKEKKVGDSIVLKHVDTALPAGDWYYFSAP